MASNIFRYGNSRCWGRGASCGASLVGEKDLCLGPIRQVKQSDEEWGSPLQTRRRPPTPGPACRLLKHSARGVRISAWCNCKKVNIRGSNNSGGNNSGLLYNAPCPGRSNSDHAWR